MELIKKIQDTESQLDELRNQFLIKLKETYERYAKDFNIKYHWNYYHKFYIQDTSVDITFELYHCGCCPPNYETVEIPLNFFEDYEKAKERRIANDKRRDHLLEIEKEKRKKILAQLKENRERKKN